MPDFIERVKDRIKDPSRDFKERVFIVLNLIIDFLVLCALIGDIVFHESIVEIVMLSLIVVLTPTITLVSVKLNRTNFAIIFNVIALVFVTIPVVFYFGGGLYGGGVLWIIFAYLYTGLVLSGKWKPVMMVVISLEACGLFLDGYFHPERVYTHTRAMFYIDSLISIIIVGVVCCAMVWFEEWLFVKENERAREEAKKFEELNNSQNRFFSNMSHEIRTPIHSILGLNELILRQEDASEEIRKDASNIQGAGRMLLSLVNDILDISKIEAGKMEIIPVNYNIASMISEIVNMFWLRIEEKGLELIVEMDPTIPAELYGDEVRIKQVLVNILNNAVKYTKEGSITLRVSLEEEKNRQVSLMFSVADTGIGIKQDAIPYLFDMFQRVDEEKNRKIEGTGLGLAIVKQLVELMGGTVTVDSTYSMGSTFVVMLNQKVAGKEKVGNINIRSLGTKIEKKYEAGFMAPNARILIVDDNEMNLEVETKLLVGSEMIIDTALSGAEALKKTYSNHYDLILMDHLMPEMDGIECLRRIRNQSGGLNTTVPVIILTANAGSDSIELYNNSGFDGYLLKPVTGRQLEEKLLRFLPERKIINVSVSDALGKELNATGGFSKKIPVIITTSSMSDMPHSVLKACNIDVIFYRVLVNGKIFYDGYEACSDELVRYMRDGVVFESEPPSEEELEEFFAEHLGRAHQVIHITMGSSISAEYKNAVEAAKAYGNVTVYNSGFNSSSLGIMVLYAYRLSTRGFSVEKIIEELDRIRDHIQCSFVTNDVEYLVKRGRMNRSLGGLMQSLDIRPFLRMKNDRLTVGGLSVGNLDKCYDRYVEYALSKKKNPDLDVCFVSYVDVSQEELAAIRKKILECYAFRNVIFVKASAVMSLNCGAGAIGVMYVEKGEHPYNFSSLLNYKDDSRYFDAEEEHFAESLPTRKPIKEFVHQKKWYETIPGIDGEEALKNSGSEDSLRSVLNLFYESVEEKWEELNGYFESENWENYTIKVHALKSSANIIGAKVISKEAEKLELAGKDKDISYIKQNHEELLSNLMALKAMLENEFGTKETPKKEENTFDGFLMESLLEAVLDGARKKDESMIYGVLKEMEEYRLPEVNQNTINEIKRCFDAKDYDRMIRVVEETAIKS